MIQAYDECSVIIDDASTESVIAQLFPVFSTIANEVSAGISLLF